ncbi:hypothetical protein [Nocardia miyunensis]|uniref:hypothetical protein n=1 Tax=Nocardia miyunensis TaxID=282684 RepID=UPI00082B1AB9|nr:hypothetical protein [Nocardia miyunensis]
MHEYLGAYGRERGLTDLLRLGTEVESAMPKPGGGSALHIREVGSARSASVECDHLVVANGVCSDPAIPGFPGAGAFAAVGGPLCHTTGLGDGERARGEHMVIVDYGGVPVPRTETGDQAGRRVSVRHTASDSRPTASSR